MKLPSRKINLIFFTSDLASSTIVTLLLPLNYQNSALRSRDSEQLLEELQGLPVGFIRMRLSVLQPIDFRCRRKSSRPIAYEVERSEVFLVEFARPQLARPNYAGQADQAEGSEAPGRKSRGANALLSSLCPNIRLAPK